MSPMDAHPERTETVQRVSRLRRAQRLLDRLFRSMPLERRLRIGAFMAFKVALSASVAYAVGQALHTEQAFWAAISAVAVTQPHFGDTRGAGRDRCLGTVLGGIAGFLGLWAGGSGNILAFALGLGLVTIVCWMANAAAAARIAGITAAIVLLVPSVGPSWEVPLMRLGEVVLGTVCALVIGWAVSRLEERVEQKEEEGTA